jgi:hypothetical protein
MAMLEKTNISTTSQFSYLAWISKNLKGGVLIWQ